MADARLPDAFYDLVCHHLLPEKPIGPKGGRPPIVHRIVLNVEAQLQNVDADTVLTQILEEVKP